MTFWGFDVFAVGLIFARVGALVMLMPGFGEVVIPANVRLAFALALCLVLAPIVGPKLPHTPDDIGATLAILVSEIAVGLLLGGILRILMAALTTAGQIAGLETGLSFAQMTDPTQGQAGEIISVFLGLFGVTMIFATNLHHVFIGAMVGSYDVFAPAKFPSLGDSAALAVKGFGDAFRLGVQMAAPLMLAGLVFRVGLGVLSRLIPQIQVFFVAMPMQVLGGFIIFALGLSAGILVWLDALQRFAGALTEARMADENQDDKTEEPTQRKLSEARKRGEIIYSSEVGAWMVLAAGAMSIAMMGGPMAQNLGVLLVGLLSSSTDIAADPNSLEHLFADLLLKVGASIGLVALMLCAAALAARFVQDQPAWSMERMTPSLDKINPMKGFSRVFGAAAFSAFAKGMLKLVIVGSAVAWALWPRDATFETTPLRDLAAFWPVVQQKAMVVVQSCLAAFGVIAAGDYFFTRQSYMKRMRMSRQELRDEFRQSEGDPQVRARLRQVRSERSRRRMMANVPKATVVVTNPTHYAVALRYEAGDNPAPICVAKGVDDVALKIRETAEAHAVPIVEDPPLARALFASAELDEVIPRQHYEAVAKVISYVMRLAARRRSRPSRGPN